MANISGGTRLRSAIAVAVFALLAASCTDSTGTTRTTDPGPTSSVVAGTTGPPGSTPSTSVPTRPSVPVPTFVGPDGFDDHTVPAIPTTPEYFALARTGASGQSVVKFTIADMTFGPEISWMDSNFYTLHDEWYWFRLLNGAAVPGSDLAPEQWGPFATVSDVYNWALAIPEDSLPFDLQFVGSQSVGTRLYSDRFYDLALDVEPRAFGLGSLLHFPTSPEGRGERWVIELEYHDDPTPAEVATFFSMIAGSVPAEIGDKLEWVLRSPEQEEVAALMAGGQLPYHDRIVRYSQLVAPGQVAVYNEGIAAGRLLIIGEGGKDLSDAGENDLLLVDTVPDFLPPGRALISSAPQTPLAHVNLLARNRGIPNASQAGILQDAGVQQAARVRAPAIVRAGADSGLEIVLITEDQYDLWLKLNTVTPIAVPRVDAAAQPYVIALEAINDVVGEADLARWRPVIGGKAAGFINMIAAGDISLPDQPMAITVRAYFEHLARVEPELDALFTNASFAGSRRTRYLVLEGPSAFADFYTEEADREFAETFAAAHPPGTAIGDVLAAGGFGDYLRDQPVDPVALAAITAALEAAYGDYALSQGLRFRSSSTVEDIEGFNGAGLYDSNTGFFRPDIQLEANEQKKSIEWAIKRTWASYWGFEAFEERQREGVDHRSGGMAVLAHARFDDPLELSNGVFTFTILPDGDDYEMVINVQDGDVSVTNPDPTLAAVPEAYVVRQSGTDPVRITRTSDSSLVEPGVRVLDDGQIAELFGQAKSVGLLWRDRVNASLPPEQRVVTLTLDHEFKEMAAGWPARRGAFAPEPARLVIKQARTLEPGLRDMPAAVASLPIPRDILARARLVEELSCGDSGAAVSGIVVFTDPLQVPDMGHGTEPFVIPINQGFAPGDDCARQTLFSTPDQYLVELLENGQLLNLSQ